MPAGLTCSDLDAARKHLARIHCLRKCIECIQENKPFPEALAYCPSVLQYRSDKNIKVTVYSRPSKTSKPLQEFVCSAEHIITVSGEEWCNSDGRWAHFIKAVARGKEVNVPDSAEKWLLLFNQEQSTTDMLTLISCRSAGVSSSSSSSFNKSTAVVLDDWLDVVEHEYALRLSKTCTPTPVDPSAVARLRFLPPKWTMEQDEDLAMFLGKHADGGVGSSLGSIKDYVESIDVSSKSHGDREENLTDNDPNTFWESDGSHGSHWIRLRMKKGIVIKKLLVTVGGGDSNYMPQLIHVMGGDSVESVRRLNEINIDQSMSGIADVLILSEQTEFFAVIEIRIKECKDHGIDTRIRGLKIKSCHDVDVGISRDLFVKTNLVRFPKLENFEQDVIYRRALILDRMMKLLDSVLIYLVPLWDYSTGSYASLDAIRQLLPLSQKRTQLIDQFLGKTEMSAGAIPKIYINRRSALEHRADPSRDAEYRNSVFTQIYEGLKPKDIHHSPQHYRWGAHNDQWWECKFLSEGIIDQGGGFRDSISDLSEELCPSSRDEPEPLPFFIRSPNQRDDDASNNRDMYVPNPSCSEFHKYEWIGKLMGACLRGKEFLVLSLPSFFWKQLSGQPVTWQKDFCTVDEYEVRSIEALCSMDEQTFASFFSERPRTWTATLSDGTTACLKTDGASLDVTYSDRLEYAQLVREARMSEGKKQVEAIQRGLLQVIPQAVLELLTSHELERRICGDPEISMDALRKNIHFKDHQANDSRVTYMWTALENFSNEDRSRLIRFVTGRRRLPAAMHIFWGDSSQDALPTSSTCGSSLFLPNYSSAKIMEEKLRYAMYNCVSIDTDTSPLDEY